MVKFYGSVWLLRKFFCVILAPVCFRLLEELMEKEREYQCILHQVLEEREREIKLLKSRSEPVG